MVIPRTARTVPVIAGSSHPNTTSPQILVGSALCTSPFVSFHTRERAAFVLSSPRNDRHHPICPDMFFIVWRIFFSFSLIPFIIEVIFCHSTLGRWMILLMTPLILDQNSFLEEEFSSFSSSAGGCVKASDDSFSLEKRES